MTHAHVSSTQRFTLVLAVVTFALLAGVAFAMDVPFDPVTWGGNPAIALLALTGFIAWLRSTPFGQRLDGPVLVPLVTVAVGAAAGAGLQLANLLTYAPYATWTSPLGGLAYGALIAASAVTGVSLFNYGAAKVATRTTITTAANTAAAFIADLLKKRFAGSIPVAAWNAVSGVLAEYATSDAVLTDDLRATIQAKVLAALRAAGLGGVDLE